MDLFIKYKTATNAYILEFLFYKKKKKLKVCEDRLECVKKS